MTEEQLYQHCLNAVMDCMHRLEMQDHNALSDSFLPALKALYAAKTEMQRKGAFR